MQIGVGRLLAICLLTAVLGGAVTGLMLHFMARSADEAGPELVSNTPGLDYIDAYSCDPGLIKTVVMRGVEDGFDRAGEERAVPRLELLENAAIADMYYRRLPNALVTRDYDERGKDKKLIDSFEVERGVVSGVFVASVEPQGANENDAIVIGNLDEREPAAGVAGKIGFYYAPSLSGRDWEPITGLLTIPLTEFQAAPSAPYGGSLVRYINAPERPDLIDLDIEEDTMVDFAALVTCRQPDEARGTAFRESSRRIPIEGMSLMMCGQDGLAPLCSAESGYRLCSDAVPIACYKDGSRKIPETLSPETRKLYPFTYFVPGEVRMSAPVRGDTLPTRADASAVCAAEFGEGWRVLRWHEGGGGGAMSYSNIAPNTEGLVHTDDRPYGNCWDRPESVIGK